MEVVNVVNSVWIGFIIASDSHVSTFLSVGSDVFSERRGLLEAAAAEGTAAGSLSGVDELVVLEMLQSAQTFPTDGTHVGFLSCVRASVFAQTVQMSETVPTLRAGVRLLPRVDTQVSLQST